jgi:hypothetical protein
MANNSFAPALRNRFSRKWGGSAGDGVDPYITGYHFIHFSYLPPRLVNSVRQPNGRDNLSQDDIKNLLSAACLSVTLPGGIVNKTEFNGLGGTKWAVPTNVDYDTSMSIRFLEFSSLPILAIMHGWTRMIRDYRAGVTPLDSGGSNDSAYSKSQYAGTMYYWTTKPDGRLVEYYACLTGVFPMKDPTDQYGSDLTTVEKLELDIDWNVDTLWHESWVKDRCQSLANTFYSEGYGGATGSGKANTYGSSEPSV